MSELFLLMVAAFCDAEQLIRQGKVKQARLRIISLPESVYSLALDWYDNEHKNYYYYLVRFVLDTFETESAICSKPQIKENIALYRDMVDSLTKPSAIYVKGELLAFNQLELFNGSSQSFDTSK